MPGFWRIPKAELKEKYSYLPVDRPFPKPTNSKIFYGQKEKFGFSKLKSDCKYFHYSSEIPERHSMHHIHFHVCLKENTL